MPPKLQMPGDTKKLKKHITIVCDRLSKGARLTGNNVMAKQQASRQQEARNGTGGAGAEEEGKK